MKRRGILPRSSEGSHGSRPRTLAFYLMSSFLLVTLLPMSLLGMNQLAIHTRVRTETARTARVLAHTAAEALATVLESVRHGLESIASRLDAPGTPEDAKPLLDAELRTLGVVKRFLLIGPDGVSRLAAPEAPELVGRYFGDSRLFEEARTYRGPNYSDSRVLSELGEDGASISIASPSGYVAVAELDLYRISEWIRSITEDTGADVRILDSSGAPVGNPDPNREPFPSGFSASAPPRGRDADGYRYSRGGERFVAFANQVPGSPWHTLVSFRERDFDFLQAYIAWKAIAGGAAVLGLAFSAAFFLNRRLNQSLADLLAAARAMADEAVLSESRPRSPFAEMDELLGEFSRMRRRVYLREEELKQSLAGREMLLKEIHHRVKNNLQIVASLLALQRERIENPEAFTALSDSAQRVQSLSLVHEKLYQSSDFATLDLAEYLLDFAHGLLSAYGAGQSFDMRTHLEPTEADIDTAIPVGMCVNEILSNAIKYGKPGNSVRGLLRMDLKREGQGFRLEISDNGPGFDPESARKKGSLGLLLIESLVSQIRGTLRIDSGEGGSRFEITVPSSRVRKPAAP